MTTNRPTSLSRVDKGSRLAEAQDIINAILNLNGASSNYSITASGNSAATATKLTSVINEIDINSSAGVSLPLSSGKQNSPYQICFIINNSASSLNVYGYPGSADTINGTSGAAGVSQSAGISIIYVSAKAGAWFSIGSSSGGAPTITGRTALTTPITMLNSDGIVNVALTVPGTVTINGASGRTAWQSYTIKDAAGNAFTYPITYTPHSGTIDGQASLQIQQNYDSLTIYSDGTNEFTE